MKNLDHPAAGLKQERHVDDGELVAPKEVSDDLENHPATNFGMSDRVQTLPSLGVVQDDVPEHVTVDFSASGVDDVGPEDISTNRDDFRLIWLLLKNGNKGNHEIKGGSIAQWLA